MYITLPTEHGAAPVHSFADVPSTSQDTCLKSGKYLYFEDDPVDWLYLVKSGVLRLTRLFEDGRRQVIAFGYPGDIVGFPSNGLHHTDCEVLVDARLQPFRRSVLEDGHGDAQLHKILLQAALREISGMQDHFMMLGRKSATEKIASFLCVLSDRVGEQIGSYVQVQLPMSRTDIADFLGLTTETVSRTLTQFRKRNTIAVENINTVIILKPEELLRLSLGDTD